MKKVLNELFLDLDMNSENGLASVDDYNRMSVFQKVFFEQVKEKIGVDAVFFLRDYEGNAKIPLVFFKAIDSYCTGILNL